MKQSSRIGKLEIKRNINKIYITGLIIFVLLSVLILQVGITKYKNEIKRQAEFVSVEKRKVERYINYTQYGLYGFRVLLIPSPLIAFFNNSTTLSDLQAFIDSGVRLNFSRPEIGENMFKRPTGGSLDFSWYILIIGSMIILTWGFFSYRNKEYIRFLMNFANVKSVYLGIILARILLIVISLSITLCVGSVQFYINGIKLSHKDISSLFVFLLVAIITMVFVLVVGSLMGTVKGKIKGILMAGSFWLIAVFLWPEVLTLVFSEMATLNMKSRYKHEIEKINILMEFEKIGLVNTGRYKTIPEKRQSDKLMAEYYWDNEFKKVEKLEFDMMEKTADNVKKFHFCSILNPVTNYKSINNELSSKGYNSYMAFYRNNQKLQKGFLRYYINKKYYENYSKVKPYLSGKNIFISKISLPNTFLPGVMLNLFYIFLLCGFSYRRFKKRIIGDPGKIIGLEIDIKPGKLNYLLTRDEGLKNQVFNYFTGRGQKFIDVKIDGQEPERRDFVYLPDIQKIPNDISEKALYKLLFKQKLKERYKKWEILIDYAFEKAPNKIIILDDFFKNLRNNEIEEIKREIESKGLVSLYISGNYYQALAIADKVFFSLEDRSVDALKEINDSKKGKT